MAKIVMDDSQWRRRCQSLRLDVKQQKPTPDTPPPDAFEDVDFGDFQDNRAPNMLHFDNLPLPSTSIHKTGFFGLSTLRPGPYYLAYKALHSSLIPACRHLRASSSPSSTLSLLFPKATSLSDQADYLLTLFLFLSSSIQPLHDWGFLRQALLAAADRFDSSCLVAFEVADGRNDEAEMRAAAASSWKVWAAGGGERDQWECGRVWVEKREVFYETSKWNALENIV